MTFIDPTPVAVIDGTYAYRVAATNLAGSSTWSNTATITVPGAPSNFLAQNGPNSGTSRSVVLRWTDNSTIETGFTIQRATNSTFTQGLAAR